MPFPFAGELAALATSFFWALGPLFFTLAGRELGSVIVNRLRLLAATLMLILMHAAVTGHLLPSGALASNWFWLAASGVVGLVIGDALLFQALIMIGTRLTMLVFGLSPMIAALLAWIFLGESMGGVQILGVLVTLAGVSWVVSDRPENGGPGDVHAKGLMLAVGAAAAQALGLLLARQGLVGELPALSGYLIRLGSATVVMWAITILRGSSARSFRAARARPKGAAFTLAGAVMGPLLGIWLSLLAIRYTSLGVASTLMALPPLILLPIDRIFFGIRIKPRAVWGTLLALSGVALLFLA